jgi:hypothetical protein
LPPHLLHFLLLTYSIGQRPIPPPSLVTLLFRGFISQTVLFLFIPIPAIEKNKIFLTWSEFRMIIYLNLRWFAGILQYSNRILEESHLAVRLCGGKDVLGQDTLSDFFDVA